MRPTYVQCDRKIPVEDMAFYHTFRFQREMKHVRYNMDDLVYQTLFIPKPVLRPEYSILFEHQGFLCNVYIGCIFLITLKSPEESDLLYTHQYHQIVTTGQGKYRTSMSLTRHIHIHDRNLYTQKYIILLGVTHTHKTILVD